MSRGLILGIESSCDETAAAVVERGEKTLSSVVASQIATHARYGGVVPELASREHLRAIVPVVHAALAQADIALADLDAIAVTSGPGLAGALLVGISYAKALAFAQRLPLIAVNHLEGHIHAVLLQQRSAPDGQNSLRDEPALALVVSGGHTHLYLASRTSGTWSYSLVGRTVDDAAGEAYDKVAKLLGFGYPGGPWIDCLARFGNPQAVPFAFAQIKIKAHLAGKAPRTKAAKTAPIANLDPHFMFSFSGIKTAVLRYVELHNLRAEAQLRAARLFPPTHQNEPPLKGHEVSGGATGSDGEMGALEAAENLAILDKVSEEGPSEAKALSDFAGITRGLKPPPPSVPSFSTSYLAPEAAPTHLPQSREEALGLCSQEVLDLVASFQHAVVGDLMKKTFAAAESLGATRILVTGGVAANRELRARFQSGAAHRGVSVAFPTLALSTDNAAMIAAAAWPRFQAGEFAAPDLSADPSLALGAIS
jgi:glycoprotease/Kae1 family metallohydrolase